MYRLILASPSLLLVIPRQTLVRWPGLVMRSGHSHYCPITRRMATLPRLARGHGEDAGLDWRHQAGETDDIANTIAAANERSRASSIKVHECAEPAPASSHSAVATARRCRQGAVSVCRHGQCHYGDPGQVITKCQATPTEDYGDY